MKDQRPISPLKRISLVFLTLGALSITSTLLTSCSETANAASDHLGIENRLTRIEAQLTDQGSTTSDMNKTVTTMADLTSKLSSDIGDMSVQIGYMADRIVETEYLIVSVITNQTTAATGVIAKASNPIKNDPLNNGKPSNDPADKLYQGPTNNDGTIPQVLDLILQGHSGSNGVLLSVNKVNPVTPSTTTPPSLKFNGSNVKYVLVVSTAGTFDIGKTTQQTINPNAVANTAENLTTAWQAMMGNLKPAPVAGSKVFVAVKVISTGNLSPMSNTLNFTL